MVSSLNSAQRVDSSPETETEGEGVSSSFYVVDEFIHNVKVEKIANGVSDMYTSNI